MSCQRVKIAFSDYCCFNKTGFRNLTFFSLCSFNRILEVARCSQLTDVGFTTLARVRVSQGSAVGFHSGFCVCFRWGEGRIISGEAAERESAGVGVRTTCAASGTRGRGLGGRLSESKSSLLRLDFSSFIKIVNDVKQGCPGTL